MTLVHLTIIFCLSALTRQAVQWWTGKPRVTLRWKEYLRKVAPTGEFYLESGDLDGGQSPLIGFTD